MTSKESPPQSAEDDLGDGRITPALLVAASSASSSRFLRFISAVENRFAAVLRWIMFVSLLALSLLMVAQVVMRYVLQWPFLGIEEMAPLLALWCYFSGMVYSTRHRTHIEGGILTLITSSPAITNWARTVGTAAAFIALVVFIYYAIAIAQFNINISRKSVYLRWPRYLWDFAFLGGMVGMTIYLLLQLLFELKNAVTSMGRR